MTAPSMRPAGLVARIKDPFATRSRRRRILVAYTFMLPSLIVLAVFMFYPLIRAAILSFTNYSVFGVTRYVGLSNYITLFHNSQFWGDLVNTVYYAGVTTPVSVALALALALLLNRRGLPARGVLRAAIFLPAVVSLAVAAIPFRLMFTPSIGLITYWLGAVGVHSTDWLDSTTLAMPAVIIVGIWKNVGFYMVIYIAGLQTIPKEFYEAARIDGASTWRRFRNITWPLLSNTTMFVTIIALIASFQAFDQIFVMTQGGPAFSTETLVMLIYRQGFQQFQLGYASAIGYILVLIILLFSLFQMRYFNRRAIRY
ncbi:MAG TPA: sugar ABC transporter permease [Streptosporangiaceae bacterium]|nr:sugar ABC transporter permease [Streptosporangiaceae bacterium]